MKFFTKIGGKETEFSLDHSGGEFTLSDSNGEGKFDLQKIGSNIFHLLSDTGSHLMLVTKSGEDYYVSIDGKSHLVSVEDNATRLKRLHGGNKKTVNNAGNVSAPIPGLVVRISVSEGDSVAVDTPLLALEAMKMENEIKSPIDGTVSKINVKEGESVPADTILMVIKP